jgi:hypothetical protein
MKYYFFSFIALLLFACQDSKTDTGQANNSNSQNNTTLSSENELIINGNDIWIRNMPYNGEVTFKLNQGDRCKIIEKGQKDQVNNIFDFWYRIEFNGKSGWVFGSQTNKNTNESIVVNDFNAFLKEFAKDYSKKTKIPEKYIQNTTGKTFLFNPGAYCVAYTDETNAYNNRNILVPNVFEGTPKGDFCEGYPNAKDGFYYEVSSYDMLPKFAVFSDKSDEDVITGTIVLPDNLTNNDFKMVQIVIDGYHFAYLYFINIDKGWYLICENYCDCSA